MRILPVLDLQNGAVVRGVAGRRHEYNPVVSRLTASCQPLAVARAFREHFGLRELYVADLDAIAGASPAMATFADLQQDGFSLLVDAGVQNTQDASAMATPAVRNVVVGLETVAGPAELEDICHHLGSRIVFSLDLHDGQPLGDGTVWGNADALTIAGRAIAAGARRFIVIDLSRVGVGKGIGTEQVCRILANTYPDIEITTGGGVRGVPDLERLFALGVGGVLVASALHDGGLTRADVQRFHTR